MKKKVIILVIVFFVVLFGAVGIYFLQALNAKTVSFDENAEAQYDSTIIETPKDGTKPSDHTALENVAFVLYKLQNTNAFSSETTGTAKASVATQKISNKRTVIGNTALVQTISGGLISVGKQKYFINDGEKVILRDMDSLNQDTLIATWKSVIPEVVSKQGYIGRYGWLPFQLTGYILCEETILEASNLEENDNGTFSIKLALNPDSDAAPFWYKREVATNGSSTIEPRFEYVYLTLTFDETWTILSVDTQEKYVVKSMGIETSCVTNCHEEFSYDNISFNENALDFFKEYETYEPVDNLDMPKIYDSLDLIVSSLSNPTGKYGNLNLNVKINDNEIKGLVKLDISDLEHVLLKADLNNIKVEFKDNVFYLVIGSNFNLKMPVSDLTDLIGMLPLSGEVNNTIDTKKLVSAISHSEIIIKDSNITINSILPIGNINIPLTFNIKDNQGKYEFVSAKANVNFNEENISFELTNSDLDIKEIENIDNFNEIKDTKFVFDLVGSVLTNEFVNFDINATYKSLNINALGNVDFRKEDISFDACISIEYNNKNINIDITYKEDYFYVTFLGYNFKISKENLNILLTKLGVKTNSFNISIEDVINKILSINYDELIKQFDIKENDINITLGLKELFESLEDLKIKIYKDENVNFKLEYVDFIINSTITSNIKDICLDDVVYQDIAYISYIFDDVLAIVDTKALNVVANLNINNIDLSLDMYVGFLNEINVSLDLDIKYQDKNLTLNLYYLNDNFYINFSNIKLKLSKNDLVRILSNQGINISLDEKNFNIDEILDVIFNIDYQKIIKDLEIYESNIKLSLDLSNFISKLNDLDIIISNSLNGVFIDTNLYNAKALLKSVEYKEININDEEYNDLVYAEFLINDCLLILKNKFVNVNLTAVYKNINVNVDANVSFKDELKLSADIEFNKDGKLINIKVTYLDDVVFIDLFKYKFKISVDDLIKILNNFDINLSGTINLESILNMIFRIDFDNLINYLKLQENEVLLSLNLHSLIETLENINIIINDNKNGFDVSLDIFDIKMKIESNEEKVIVVEGKYQDLGNVISFIDDIKEIIDTKVITLDAKINIKDIDINVTGIVDFNDIKNIKAKVNLEAVYNSKTISADITYLDNNLYLDIFGYKLKMSKDDLLTVLAKFDINLDLNSDMLDKIFNIKFEEVLTNLELNKENIKLGLNLESIIKKALSVNINLSHEDGIKLELDKYDLALKMKSTSNSDITVEGKYQDLGNVLFVTDLIRDILDSKKLRIEIDANKDDIKFNGAVNLSLEKDNVKAYVDLVVSYKSIELPIELYYFNSTKECYLSYNNIHVSFNLTTILSKFDSNLDSDSLDINKIIDLVFNVDFVNVLTNLVLTNNEINIGLNLDDYKNKFKDIIDLSNIINLTISRDTNVNLSSTLFNLNAVILTSFDSFNFDQSINYVNIDSLVDNALDLVKMIGKNSFEVTLSGNIDINKFISVGNLDLNSKIYGYVKAVLVNEEYQFEGDFTLDVLKTKTNVKFIIIDKILYITIGGANVKIDLANIKEFILDIKEIFNKTDDVDLIDNIGKILETLEFNEGYNLSAYISSLTDKLSILTIYLTQILNSNIDLNIYDGYDNLAVDLTLNVKVDDSLELSNAPELYIDEEDIKLICKNVKKIIDLVKKEAFTISFGANGNSLVYYEDGKIRYKASGSLEYEKTIDSFNLEFNLLLDEYYDGIYQCKHQLNIILYDNVFYATYSNATSPNDAIKATCSVDNLYSLIATIEKVFDFDLSFLDKIVDISSYLSSELNYVDFTQVKNLFNKILNSNDILDGLVISDILTSLTCDDISTVIQLNLTKFLNKNLNENLIASVEIVDDLNYDYPLINLNDLYIKYDTNDKFNKITNLNISFSNETNIVGPKNTNGYYNLSEIDELINCLAVTATQTDFEISGTVKLNVNILTGISFSVPISAYVHVNEDGSPTVYVTMDIPKVSALVTLLSKKTVNIIYEDEFIYINRVDSDGTTHKIKVDKETFFDDIPYYLLDLGMGLPDMILNLIGKNEKDGYVYVNAAKAVTDYYFSFANNTKSFTFGLNMGEILGNSDLEELRATLNLKPVYVGVDEEGVEHDAYAAYSISNFSFNMVKVISITCSELKLKNIKNINNHNRFTELSLGDLNDYVLSYKNNNFVINGNEIEMDTIYKNNKKDGNKIAHKAYFHTDSGVDLSGNELELITVSASAESYFNVPTMPEYMISNSKQYYFGGWYSSANFEEDTLVSSSQLQMGNKNAHYYAKWVLMYQYEVIDVLGKGYSQIYKSGEETKEYVVDDSLGDFLGYYDYYTDELITKEVILPSAIIKDSDIRIYAKWNNMTYLIVGNNKYIIKDINDDSMISGLTDEYYSVLVDDVYYSYNRKFITSKFLLNKYSSLLNTYDNGYFTETTLIMYPFIRNKSGYNTYSLILNDKFKDKDGYNLYSYIQTKSNVMLKYSDLPYASYEDFEINYYYDSSYNSYSLNSNETINGTVVKAGLTTKASLFSYENNNITKLNKSVSILVTPMFNNSILVTGISDKAFMNSNVEKVVISSGIKTIGIDAFKNCKSLNEVYIASTVTSISEYAFYYDIDIKWGYCSYVDKLMIHVIKDELGNGFDYNKNLLLAYNDRENRYYGKKYDTKYLVIKADDLTDNIAYTNSYAQLEGNTIINNYVS